MAILKAQANPEELINFLGESGIESMDIDAMEIQHHPSHTFEKNGKKFYIIVLYTDGAYKEYVESALKSNNRDFYWS